MFKHDHTDYWSFDKLEGEVRNHGARWNAVANMLAEDKGTLLDVGAGTGFLARTLRDRNSPLLVLSSDIRPEYVDGMKKLGLTAEQGDIRDLRFNDRAFDVVTATEVLEHMIDPGKALSELIRVAKRKVIFTLPCKRVNDPYHGWKVRATIEGEWVVVELERDDNP